MEGYTPFGELEDRAFFGECAEDAGWDVFLQSTPQGEYQQSSMWGRVKAAEGWKVARVIVTDGGKIGGGFQILWKKSRGLRIGYAARGPVWPGARPEQDSRLTRLLKTAARRLKLAALVVQCPAEAGGLDPILESEGFCPNRLLRIITATWITPVSGGIAQIEAGMRRTTRRTLKLAIRSGVTVREGTRSDMGTFFELMKQSAQRQGVSPNPATEAVLLEVWDAFKAGAECRLTLAMHNGTAVSGLLCLCFGKTVHVWKKGSLPESLPLHPMELLYHDALAWADRTGYASADFEGMSRGTALSILSGTPMTDSITGSRDFYNIGFGGHPRLLAEARIYFSNPAIRYLYRKFACSEKAAPLLRKRHAC